MSEILEDMNEGVHGAILAAFAYDFSATTNTNYFRHDLFALCKTSNTSFTDMYERFIQIIISHVGLEGDRTIYVLSEFYQNLGRYLSSGQHVMPDMDYAGDEELFVPPKKIVGTSFMYLNKYNRYIRNHRIVLERFIGYLNNQHRIFLGQYSIDEDLFDLASMTFAKLVN